MKKELDPKLVGLIVAAAVLLGGFVVWTMVGRSVSNSDSERVDPDKFIQNQQNRYGGAEGTGQPEASAEEKARAGSTNP